MSRWEKLVKLVALVIILYQLTLYITFYQNSTTLQQRYTLQQFSNEIVTKDVLSKQTRVPTNFKKFHKTKMIKPAIRKVLKSHKTKIAKSSLRKASRHKKRKSDIKVKKIETLRVDSLSSIPVYGSSLYWKENDDVISSLPDLGIQCKPIIQQNHTETQRMKSILSEYDKLPLRPAFYSRLTSSCDDYKRKRGFITEVTQEEGDFPIAFGILMHEEMELTERLLRAIYRPSNFYCIHVDAKAPKPLQKAMSDLTKCFDNVHIASRLEKVEWGKYSVFQADLNCMDDLLPFKWKYYINLAGSEFPLKTNLEMIAILKAFNGASSISGAPFRKKTWKYRMSRTVGNVTGFTMKKGSQHIIANRKFMEFIRTAPKALRFAKWLKNALHPHETFYNSIYFSKNLHIPGSYNGSRTGINEREAMGRFKIWFNQKQKCSGKYAHGICIFGLKELPLLIEAPHLFCNKFHEDFMPVVLDCLEAWFFDKIQHEKRTRKPEIGTEFYSNLDYVQNQIFV